MKTKTFFAALATGVLLLSGMSSCNRDKQTGHLQLRMMDAPSPFNFDAIYVDVIGVEVNIEPECCDPEWLTLNSGAGVYNLLTLVNGTDVILVNEDIPAGRINQVRLILGSGNTIVVDGVSHPLTIPSGSESGLKINVHQTLEGEGDVTLMLDFDAAHSIHITGNGEYKLKPVIRGFVLQDRGAIHGVVTPASTGIAVIATSGNNTFTTYADAATGHFLIRGVMPGTYTVSVYLPNVATPVVYNNVVVTANATTEIP